MNKSEEKELYFKIGREEGVNEKALELIWLVRQRAGEMGIPSTMRDEATVRAAMKSRKDEINGWDLEPFSVDDLARRFLAEALINHIGNLMKGGDDDGERTFVQGFGRVQGSC